MLSRGWDGVLTIFSDSEIFPPITKWSLCIKSHIGMAPQTGMGNRLVRGIHLFSVRAFTHFIQRIIKTFLINVAAPLVKFLYQEGHKSPIHGVYYRNGTDHFYFYSMQLCGFFTNSKSYLTSPFFIKGSYKSQFINIIKSNFQFNLLYQMKSTQVIQFHTSVSNEE